MLLMLRGHLAKASRNFAKPVSYKDITEAMQKAVQSIEGTKRQYCEVLRNETILKYRIAQNFDGGKFWRFWCFPARPSNLTRQIV